MTILQRWKHTALHNKAMVMVGVFSLLAIVGYNILIEFHRIEDRRPWIEVRKLQMTEFNRYKGMVVSAVAVNIGKTVANVKEKRAPVIVLGPPDAITSQDIATIVGLDNWRHVRIFGPLPIFPGGTWCIGGHGDEADAKAWIDTIISAGPKHYPFDLTPITSDPLRAVVELVKMKKASIVVLGEITYGTSKWTRFCGIYAPDNNGMTSCPAGYDGAE